MLAKFKRSASFASALEGWIGEKYSRVQSADGPIIRLFWLSTSREFDGASVELVCDWDTLRLFMVAMKELHISQEEAKQGYPNIEVYDVEAYLDGEDFHVPVDSVLNNSYIA